MKKFNYLYKISNLVNGKYYIPGQGKVVVFGVNGSGQGYGGYKNWEEIEKILLPAYTVQKI